MFKAIIELGKLLTSLIGLVFLIFTTLYKVCSNLFGLYKDNKGTEKEIERLTREIELAERKRCLDNKLNHK
ncbi:hypothetical protein BCV44_15375 [Vibrio cyclitrophicus]|nr:hypothetical protein BCV44_15375 [Vibrio cyclitrophicus]